LGLFFDGDSGASAQVFAQAPAGSGRCRRLTARGAEPTRQRTQRREAASYLFSVINYQLSGTSVRDPDHKKPVWFSLRSQSGAG
jgi:hypothetical protein